MHHGRRVQRVARSTSKVSQNCSKRRILPSSTVHTCATRASNDLPLRRWVAAYRPTVGAEQARRLMAIYPYPNQAMHQPDEKNQLNLFLGEWLAHCLACGHEMEPVAQR